ncbi:uncharacterized protein A4U43_UnF9770 [Asparagus officinalis]|uniref:Uncharacterized protein n=1 Tax=Asparagus officinalis TaxID=4686 RepID=A0A1R3L5M4_ASPOF|nr:uncharacterized protein LOC109828047 [Asparagus officinalis]ONK54913.1 uncharacterized protein A4U43_UnF9770 [Asparagus officinalis]
MATTAQDPLLSCDGANKNRVMKGPLNRISRKGERKKVCSFDEKKIVDHIKKLEEDLGSLQLIPKRLRSNNTRKRREYKVEGAICKVEVPGPIPDFLSLAEVGRMSVQELFANCPEPN